MKEEEDVVTLSSDDELFSAPTTFHGYEIHMLKKWSKLILPQVDIQKSKYGFYIKNLNDEQMKIITSGFAAVNSKLKLAKREIFLRSHENVKIIDSNGKEAKDQIPAGLASLCLIDLQGYKTKNNAILPIWRINELLYV